MPAEIFRPQRHYVDPRDVEDHILEALIKVEKIFSEYGLDSELLPSSKLAFKAGQSATTHNDIHDGIDRFKGYPRIRDEMERRKSEELHLNGEYLDLNKTRLELPKPFQGEEHSRE